MVGRAAGRLAESGRSFGPTDFTTSPSWMNLSMICLPLCHGWLGSSQGGAWGMILLEQSGRGLHRVSLRLKSFTYECNRARLYLSTGEIMMHT